MSDFDVKEFFGLFDKANEFIAVIVNKDKYDEVTNKRAILGLLEMMSSAIGVRAVLYCLIESYSDLKGRLIDSGVLNLNICDSCDGNGTADA